MHAGNEPVISIQENLTKLLLARADAARIDIRASLPQMKNPAETSDGHPVSADVLLSKT